jgi:AraC-like DNA-binding protein
MVVESIHQIHTMLGYPPPKHPLITVIEKSDIVIPQSAIGVMVTLGVYMIGIKDRQHGIKYGRKAIDYTEGPVIFMSPGQAVTAEENVDTEGSSGWLMFFHPDLIRGTHLGTIIDKYAFFSYHVYEALHISEDELITLNSCMSGIRHEFSQRIDQYSKNVITSGLELLLNHCQRFYDRQFSTGIAQSKDVVAQFEQELKSYYRLRNGQASSTPSIEQFAQSANLSKHYFSDLIKKETGRPPKDHINDFIVDQAKWQLISTEKPIGDIAHSLGFNYPHYFTRLFKSKTGMLPLAYRNQN